MFDKDKFKACVDWYHANLDSLLPQYYGRYVACTENGVVASGDQCFLLQRTPLTAAIRRGHSPSTNVSLPTKRRLPISIRHVSISLGVAYESRTCCRTI